MVPQERTFSMGAGNIHSKRAESVLFPSPSQEVKQRAYFTVPPHANASSGTNYGFEITIERFASKETAPRCNCTGGALARDNDFLMKPIIQKLSTGSCK